MPAWKRVGLTGVGATRSSLESYRCPLRFDPAINHVKKKRHKAHLGAPPPPRCHPPSPRQALSEKKNYAFVLLSTCSTSYATWEFWGEMRPFQIFANSYTLGYIMYSRLYQSAHNVESTQFFLEIPRWIQWSRCGGHHVNCHVNISSRVYVDTLKPRYFNMQYTFPRVSRKDHHVGPRLGSMGWDSINVIFFSESWYTAKKENKQKQYHLILRFISRDYITLISYIDCVCMNLASFPLHSPPHASQLISSLCQTQTFTSYFKSLKTVALLLRS